MSEKVLIEIPTDLADQLANRSEMVPEILRLGLRQLRVQEALLLYEQGVVTLARAAELAELPLQEMIQEARSKGIQPKWSDAMIEEEMA